MACFSRLRSSPLVLCVALACVALAACGDDDAPSGPRDSGSDGGTGGGDTGSPDGARPDATMNPPDGSAPEDSATPEDGATPDPDGGPADAGPDGSMGPDAGDPCAPQDVAGVGMCDAAFGVFWLGGRCGWVSGCSCAGRDCDAGFDSEAACEAAYAACLGGADCTTDADCRAGEQWCTGGRCVACDNSGLLCDIACAEGFDTYVRNGCSPCACAPVSTCAGDRDCGSGMHCYAGRFCWDWCPAGDPTCCLGSFCDRPGCPDNPPLACTVTGCPEGQECRSTERCFSSSCFCGAEGSWGCTRDCIRMACMP